MTDYDTDARSGYTSEQIEAALLVLISHNNHLRPASRASGIPLSTLIHWRDDAIEAGDERLRRNPTQKRQMGDIWQNVSEEYADRLLAADPGKQSAKDMAIAGGIAADKHLDYTEGRKGMSINVDARTLITGQDAALKGYSLEELEAMLAATKAQGTLPAPTDGGDGAGIKED